MHSLYLYYVYKINHKSQRNAVWQTGNVIMYRGSTPT